MDDQSTVNYVVMLAFMIFILPSGGQNQLSELLILIALFLLLISILLVSATKIYFIPVILPENFIELIAWISVFVTAVVYAVVTIFGML